MYGGGFPQVVATSRAPWIEEWTFARIDTIECDKTFLFILKCDKKGLAYGLLGAVLPHTPHIHAVNTSALCIRFMYGGVSRIKRSGVCKYRQKNRPGRGNCSCDVYIVPSQTQKRVISTLFQLLDPPHVFITVLH